MSQRTDIINAFTSAFSSISEATTRRLAFLHEVNDFPALSIVRPTETRVHIGAGTKFASLQFDLRGFVHSEDAIGSADTFARDIESCVETFSRNPLVYEARVTAVRTDEGLYAPYGIADIQVQIIYEVNR